MVLTFIGTIVQDLNSCFGLNVQRQSRGPREIGWIKPEDDKLKINVDGSCVGNPKHARFRGVLCNHNGD